MPKEPSSGHPKQVESCHLKQIIFYIKDECIENFGAYQLISFLLCSSEFMHFHIKLKFPKH